MPYLILPNKANALDRSRAAWEAYIGRKKKPEDVTEFLWSVQTGIDGRTAIEVPEDVVATLTPQERSKLVASLDEANWPKPAVL